MALPTDEVSIANIALDYIGGERISSVYSPTTDTEKIMSRHYDSVRQETFRLYIPNFSKKRAKLNKIVGTPDGDFTDMYQLPVDFVRLLSVGGSIEEEQLATREYDLTSNTLLANNSAATTIFIRYVADIIDVTKWDAGFRSLVAIQLAMAVVVQLTDSTRKAAQLMATLDKKLSIVLGVDAQEAPPRVIDRSKILARRRGFGGSFDRNTSQYIYSNDPLP